MVDKDSSIIEMAQAGLSNHDGLRHLGLVFFVVKLDASIPYYERNLFYY